MSLTFYIAHPDTLALLYDLHDPSGVNNPDGLRTRTPPTSFSLGFSNNSLNIFKQRGYPGIRVSSDRDVVEMSWKTLLHPATPGTSHDVVKEHLAEMLRILDAGAVLVYKPPTAVETQYIDILGAEGVELLRGGYFDNLIDDSDGIPFKVWRQPLLRKAELDSDDNLLVNSTLLLDTNDDGVPSSWSWRSGSNISAQSINAETESHQFTHAAVTAEDDLHQVYSGALAGETFTLSLYAKVLSGLGGWKVRVQFLDASDVPLGAAVDSALVTDGTFTRAEVTATAPSSTAKVDCSLVALGVASVPTVLNWRRGQLERGSSASPYRNGTETLYNDPAGASGGDYLPLVIMGSAPAPVSFEFTPGEAGAKVEQVLLATRSAQSEVGGNLLADLLNGLKVIQLEDGALTNASAVSDANASGPGNNTIRPTATASANQPLSKRCRVEVTNDLNSLRGTWDVYLRWKPHINKIHRWQLRWSPSLQDPATEANQYVEVNSAKYVTSAFMMTPLGRVTIPDTGSLVGIALELWYVNRDQLGTTNTNTLADCLVLVPTEKQSHVRVPAIGRQITLGKELLTPGQSGGGAGATSSNDMVLENGDAAETIPYVFPAGRNKARLRYSLEDADATGSPLVFAVYRDDSPSDVAVTTWDMDDDDPDLDDVSDQYTRTIEIEWDANGTSTYYIRVDNNDTSLPTLTVHSITTEFIPVASSSDKLLTLPETLDMFETNSGENVIARLQGSGPVPFWLEPGLHLVRIMSLDARTDGLYHFNAHVLARTLSVRIRYAPRDYI